MLRFSAEAREALQQAFKTTHHRKVHVVYLRATGMSRKAVAELFLITPATVTNYCKLYKKLGVEGLLANNYKGRYPVLTPAQEAAVRAFLDIHYVQGKALQAYLWERFHLKYSVWGALRLAHRMGYVSKKRNGVLEKQMRRHRELLSRRIERFAPNFHPIKPSAFSTSPGLNTTAVQLVV
jgi:transposase